MNEKILKNLHRVHILINKQHQLFMKHFFIDVDQAILEGKEPTEVKLFLEVSSRLESKIMKFMN